MGPGPEQPPQRRDNGLRADQFVALADVDPRMGEHLLDLLKLADIPAYLEPSTDPRVAARYPINGPIERLYVQADQRHAAREVVVAAAHEAGAAPSGPGSVGPDPSLGIGPSMGRGPDLLDGIDTDAEFARIMANYDVPPPPAVGPTALDDIAINPGPPSIAELDANAGRLQRAAAETADGDGSVPLDADDVDDHFQPPPAPPFPIPRPATVGAFLLFVLGLLVIARGAWFGLGAETSFPLGVVAILTAVGIVIRGLRDTPPEDADPDDGAVL